MAKAPKNEIMVLDIKELTDRGITTRSAKALTALLTAVVPDDVVKTHKGRGGKTLSYVPHNLATNTMNDALGMDWDWQILDYQLLPDKTAVARGQMTIRYEAKIFDFEGNTVGTEWRTRIITEMGGGEVHGENPVLCNQILSACSRALLRCMFRAFGYGGQFYEKQENEPTPSDAWKTLKTYMNKNKVTDDEILPALKKAGITKEMLLDKLEEAFLIAKKIGDDKKAPNPMADEAPF